MEDTVPPQQLADPDSRFVDINGLQVHYKMAGQGGPALVLLHGFGASVFSWREVMEPLAEIGTVIAFDRPAFGLTERPVPGEWEGESPYRAEAQVELTVGLLDELGDELPNAELVVIPHCGHIPHEECPEPFLQAVTDFVGKLP
ncbi:MAG: hypothetical protein H8E47_05355 [Anaerolineales bacterium]|nr:hypothetical protein [Anaerolineales bacterium]